MKTMRVLAAAVVVAALAGCSKGGGASGIEGTWHLDLQPMIDAQKPMLMETIKAQMAPMKQLEALPPDQREEALKMAREQVPAEFLPIMEAMLKGEKEGMAAVEKMLEEQMKSVKADIEVKSDNTWSGLFQGRGDEEKVTGTWTKEGSSYVFAMKTKNGQPATGDDAKTITFTLKDGKLEGTAPDGNKMTFKR